MPTSKAPTGTPTQSEFGALRQYLARAGFSQVQIDAAIDGRQRSRREIAGDLRDYLKTLPAQDA